MTPKTVTSETERQERLRAACDVVVDRAARMMVEEMGVSISMMLDRLLTFSAAQACAVDGPVSTAAIFRQMADHVESGLFEGIVNSGQSPSPQTGH